MPDLRGYNLTDKPEAVAAYTLDVVADDILGLLDHIGMEKGFVVGHDWGGASLWWAANKFPDRFGRIAILNVPHHRAFGQALRDNPKQRRKVAYMMFFQFKGISELAISFLGGRLLSQWAFGSNHPAFPPDVLKKYRHAWQQKGTAQGMLKWYRAAKQGKPSKLESPRIEVPTLIIWGKKDQAFLPELAQTSLDLCDSGRLNYLEEATHWVQHERAEQVNTLITDWFKG